MASIPLLLGSFLVMVVCERFFSWKRARQAVQDHPGHRRAFSANGLMGMLGPRIPGLTPGQNFALHDKFQSFQRFGWDVTADISWFPSTHTTFNLADAATIKDIVSSRATFPKPTEFYEILAMYGHNVLTTEGEQWRRYKKLVAPAFTDHNNRLVWTETVRVVAELVDEVWGDQKNIVVDHCLDITLPIALYVLSAAVFGNKISWKETNVNPAGHQMSFKDALHYASMDLLLKAAVPDWALSLTARTRRTRLAFQELGTYMKEMLQDRMSSPNTEHHDLFSILLASSSMGDAKDENLTGDEVLGNVFIFLVAGHESSAHTLCFLFALLALYQDEQEKLYQHIISVLPDKRIPVYDDMPQLTRSTAVLYETLRLFPPVIGIPKVAAQDATITFGSQSGDRKTLPISKGSRFMINTPALHHNPRYWSNPDEFQPERFMTPDWPRDAFLPFSGGPRSCLGRKFFETEAVAALTMIVSRYKVTVKQEPQFIGETFEQTKARITANKTGVTVNPIRVPLVFTRRD